MGLPGSDERRLRSPPPRERADPIAPGTPDDRTAEPVADAPGWRVVRRAERTPESASAEADWPLPIADETAAAPGWLQSTVRRVGTRRWPGPPETRRVVPPRRRGREISATAIAAAVAVLVLALALVSAIWRDRSAGRPAEPSASSAAQTQAPASSAPETSAAKPRPLQALDALIAEWRSRPEPQTSAGSRPASRADAAPETGSVPGTS